MQKTKNLLIPLPPIETQTRIAQHVQHRIQTARRLRDEARQAVENAKWEVEEMLVGGG